MKRTANIMNVKFNTLFYTALFSGLGVFSFLLLINYAAFPDKVADIFHSVGTLSFFVLAFNVLGYATMRLSTWVDNQYALNLHRRWKLISVYVVVMGMFFLLNYGLLVIAKLLAGAPILSCFPMEVGGSMITVLAGGTGHFRFAVGQPFHTECLETATGSGCLTKRKQYGTLHSLTESVESSFSV